MQGWFSPLRISPGQIEALHALLDSPDPLPELPDRHGRHLTPDFPVYSALIALLTHLRMEESEAKEHWRAIALHREELTWRLGRDPGVRVAALDHFLNRERLLLRPKLVDEGNLERAMRATEVDGLTGLLDARAFLSAVRSEVRRAHRKALEFTVALLDLDGFGAVNRACGRRMGDTLLQEVASLIRGRLRDMDSAARLAGGHFALLLPLTRRMGGFVAVDRIREAVSESLMLPGVDGCSLRLTLSGGLAAFPEDGDSAARLLQRCEATVLSAKAAGGNLIVMRTPERRSQVRYRPMGAPPGIAAEFSDGRRTGSIRIRDISATGALLDGLGASGAGEVVELRLQSDSGDRALLEAQVVWEEPSPQGREEGGRTAVRFLPRSDSSRESLQRMVERFRRQGVE